MSENRVCYCGELVQILHPSCIEKSEAHNRQWVPYYAKHKDQIAKLEAIICIYDARLYDPGFGPCPPDFSATQELLINEVTSQAQQGK